jgi:hypothetical protein
MTPRSYCLLTSGLTIIGLAIVASLNWLVDPFGHYQTGCFPVIVQASRAEKLNLLENHREPPSGLILGSSRVLKFEPEYLSEKTGLTFFNAGVNHGRPADFLAIIRWYQQRWKTLPKMVVLGVDSASLCESIPLDARITTEPRLAQVIPEAITLKDSLAKYCDLVSMKQARSSLTSLSACIRGPRSGEPTEYFASDGRIVYRQREAQLRDGVYDFESALRYNEREFDQLYKSFHQISGSEAMYLVDTVRLLREHGTKVHIFLTPFHPAMIPTLTKQMHFEAREKETRQLLAMLAMHCGAAFSDLADQKNFEGDPAAFVDGIHPLEANTRRMIDRLLNIEGGSYIALQ